MQERRLIEQAQAGDDAAWEALVRQHQQPLFRLAYLKLGDAQAAEDAAQEALIRAYQGLRRFDPGRPLRPWLLTIVSRVTANRWRSLDRYRRAVERWLNERRDEAVQSAPRLEQEQRADEMWAAIRQLPERDQNVIYLRYFLELDVAETAQALDVAEGTVKSRSSRALGRLRDVIESDYRELIEDWDDE